jgi:hypothetical protein
LTLVFGLVTVSIIPGQNLLTFSSLFPSFRDGRKDQTSDAQLRVGESRDSGFASLMRPGMTEK